MQPIANVRGHEAIDGLDLDKDLGLDDQISAVSDAQRSLRKPFPTSA